MKNSKANIFCLTNLVFEDELLDLLPDLVFKITESALAHFIDCVALREKVLELSDDFLRRAPRLRISANDLFGDEARSKITAFFLKLFFLLFPFRNVFPASRLRSFKLRGLLFVSEGRSPFLDGGFSVGEALRGIFCLLQLVFFRHDFIVHAFGKLPNSGQKITHNPLFRRIVGCTSRDATAQKSGLWRRNSTLPLTH